jgi:cysteine desulfurase/selenocysteine lyase
MAAVTAAPGAVRADPALDFGRVREDFPVLRTRIHGKPLVYLDSAATSQKPHAVISAMDDFLSHWNANVHRGVHDLSQRATLAYDATRERVRAFFNAADSSEIVFTHGTTSAINLVAHSYGGSVLRSGDEIVLTEMEHHSNIVPWQLLAQRTGAVIRVAPITDRGELRLDALEALLGPRTRIVAVTHVSNVLGTVNPIGAIADLAHAAGAVLLVDGAQSAPHLRVDVKALGCDFFVCSGHKMLGPTGVGILFGRRDLLEGMPPYEGGGGMIERVSFEGTTFAPPPARFEAGTPPVAEVIGLGAAIDYLERTDLDRITRHERSLLDLAEDQLRGFPGLRIIGEAHDRTSVLSFVLDGAHPHDVGTILDQEGVAVRAGHHCAQPLMRRLGLISTVRASFSLYNSPDDVAALLHGLRRVREVLA